MQIRNYTGSNLLRKFFFSLFSPYCTFISSLLFLKSPTFPFFYLFIFFETHLRFLNRRQIETANGKFSILYWASVWDFSENIWVFAVVFPTCFHDKFSFVDGFAAKNANNIAKIFCAFVYGTSLCRHGIYIRVVFALRLFVLPSWKNIWCTNNVHKVHRRQNSNFYCEKSVTGIHPMLTWFSRNSRSSSGRLHISFRDEGKIKSALKCRCWTYSLIRWKSIFIGESTKLRSFGTKWV